MPTTRSATPVRAASAGRRTPGRTPHPLSRGLALALACASCLGAGLAHGQAMPPSHGMGSMPGAAGATGSMGTQGTQGTQGTPGAAGSTGSGTASVSPQDLSLVSSAMQAAPARVAETATIMAAQPDGSMRVLRQGSNGFTCMPDNPTTPGPDPMCMDRNALAWAQAWMAKRPPATGRIGFMYMLAGGTDASNTDPFAQRPTAGNAWISTGPHVMVVGADSSFYDQYPRVAQPDTRQPYVMWPGTPWQHLMVPVQ